MTSLYVLAVNSDNDVRHTNLTRATGGTADLPPLDDWLGGGPVDTDKVELFPIDDLGDMSVSEYVSLAFAPKTIPAEDRARLDALEGSVLLVPSDALDGNPAPKAALTLVATLPLIEADHSGALPKADLTPLPVQENSEPAPRATKRTSVWKVVAGFIVLIGLYLLTEM